VKVKAAYKLAAVLASSMAVVAVLAVLALTVRTKVYTVGVVNINPGLESVIDGFKAGMTEAGFKEGKDIVYLYKGVLNINRVDAALQELAGRHVDLVLAVTTPVAQKAARAVNGTKIPVVFAPVFFPLESGLVKSLTHPGGNLTGVQVGGSTEKALELHKAIASGTRRILVPFVPADKSAGQCLTDLEKAAKKLGIDLDVVEVRTLENLRSVLADIPDNDDAVWLLNSHFLVSHTNIFVEAAIRHKLPLSSGTSQYNSGVMLSYGQDPFLTGRQASRIGRAILNGTAPGDIPVETSDFFLGVNLRTAHAVGVEIPSEILQQASYIVR